MPRTANVKQPVLDFVESDEDSNDDSDSDISASEKEDSDESCDSELDAMEVDDEEDAGCTMRLRSSGASQASTPSSRSSLSSMP